MRQKVSAVLVARSSVGSISVASEYAAPFFAVGGAMGEIVVVTMIALFIIGICIIRWQNKTGG